MQKPAVAETTNGKSQNADIVAAATYNGRMTVRRRPDRVSHLTFAQALTRMVSGPFAASDLVAATGLHPTTVYKLTKSLARAGAVRLCGKQPDTLGRKSVRVYELSAKKF